jgi:PAS domain S-box-containing protein
MLTNNVIIESNLQKIIIATLNTVNVFFWLKSLKSNKYLYINSSLGQLLKKDNENIKKTEIWSNLIETEAKVSLQKNYQQVIDKQLLRGRHKFKIFTPERDTRWLEEEFFIIEDNSISELYLVGFARDITATVNYEEELHEASIYFAKLAEKSEDVFWVRSPDYSKQIYVSPSYEKVWGRSVIELYHYSARWNDYLHPEDRKRLAEKISEERNASTDSKIKFYENYRIVRPDGELRYIIDCSFPIFSIKNELIGFAGIARDVTEKVSYENALQEEKEKLIRINRAKTNLLALAGSHLTESLASMSHCITYLHEREIKSDRKSELAEASQSLNALLELLVKMQELPKTQNEELLVEHILANVELFFNGTIELLGILARLCRQI